MMSKTSVNVQYDTYESPVGTLYIIFSSTFLTGVSFTRPDDVPLKKGTIPARFISEMNGYFKGSVKRFKQKIRFLKGTDFEQDVWRALNEIPFGETRTYKWIAESIGRRGAARAVGQALSKNPIPIIVPCHRVIESDGSMGGFSSGVETKVRLLDMEYYAKQQMDKTT